MMKIFDYFKGRKKRLSVSEEKPKKDKVFIAIVVVFILILAVSFISEIAGFNNTFTRNNAGIKINVSDLIILGVILISYIIVRFKKGVK